jgi:hypothetical protein
VETAQEIQKFVHACLCMHKLLREARPFTGLEYRLLETHLQRLTADLASKKAGQTHVQDESAAASG